MKFKEIILTTPNKKPGVKIIPTGIVFHDTEWFNLQGCIDIFQDKNSSASAHLLIDIDGTRYIFGNDNEKLYHAGYSIFNGWKWCNNFMLGVEFLGHTDEVPELNHELVSFRKMSFEEIEREIVESPENFCPGFVNDFNQVKDKLKTLIR